MKEIIKENSPEMKNMGFQIEEIYLISRLMSKPHYPEVSENWGQKDLTSLLEKKRTFHSKY